jgi:hypothetical protein
MLFLIKKKELDKAPLFIIYFNIILSGQSPGESCDDSFDSNFFTLLVHIPQQFFLMFRKDVILCSI